MASGATLDTRFHTPILRGIKATGDGLGFIKEAVGKDFPFGNRIAE